MSRETKIGLLVGLGFILFLGILVNDHFAQSRQNQFVDFDQRQPAGAGLPSFGREGESGDVMPRPSIEPRQGEATDSRGYELRPAPEGQRWEMFQTVNHEAAAPEQQNNRGVRFAGQQNETPGTMQTGTEQPRPSGDVIYHVKPGDTLGEISQRFLGTSTRWRQIVEANPGRIPDPDRLAVGTRIVIPRATPASTDAVQGTGEPVEIRRVRGETVYGEYTVRSGETLSELAQRFLGSAGKWRELYQLNRDRISNPDRLKPGTVIRVPHRTG